MYKPEDQAFLAEARLKLAAGTVTKDEEKGILTQVVKILREGRLAAVQQARKSRAAKSSASADALLGELGL